MPLKTRIPVLIVALLVPAFQIEAAPLIVPVACPQDLVASSCGVDQTLEAARQSYDISPAQLVGAMTSHDCSVIDDQFYWAPIQSVKGAEEQLEALEERLQTQEVDGRSQVVVLTDAPASTDGERHLAICEVLAIGAETGPPKSCATVAISTLAETYVRAAEKGKPLDCGKAISMSQGHEISVLYNILSPVGINVLARSLQTMLKEEFALQIIRLPTDDAVPNPTAILLRGSAGLRDSPILADGHREAIDVDLFIGFGNSGTLLVSFTTKPLVLREALSDFTQYHGPTDGQVSTYSTFISAQMENAIRRVCPSYRLIDDATIDCQD